MKYTAIFLILSLSLNLCENKKSESKLNKDISMVKMGVFFGMSYGYGFSDIEITQDSIKQMLRSSQPSKFPQITRNYPFSQAKWKELIDSLSLEHFFELDSIYGCPDCSDGGGEYIEIVMSSTKTHRTVFDYGENLASVSIFQNKLRDIFNEIREDKN